MTLSEFNLLLEKESAFLMYFYNDTCSVCQVLKPKVAALLKDNFPQIRFIEIYSPESREVAGQLQMLTVPGMLLFIEGREYFRASGMTSLEQLYENIRKPYELWLENK